MRTAVLLLAVTLVPTAPIRASQAPADFSGMWTATDATPPNIARAPAAPLGDKFTVRHTGDSFTLVRPTRTGTVVVPYSLDGREVPVRVPGGLCLGEAQTMEAATRAGDAIVLAITGTVPAGGGAVVKRDIRRTLRLADRDTLLVETRMMVSGETRPVATVYKRSTDAVPDPPAPATNAPATLAQLSWLAGVWSGTEKTTTVEERWTPASGGSMLAMARTMANNVMGSFEFLCIVERGGTLVYQAMPGGRSPATDFTLTAVTADSATFENPAHDYPKVIRYSKLPDGSLQTTISAEGGQRARSVVLKKQQD
jgi:hypothetical protein